MPPISRSTSGTCRADFGDGVDQAFQPHAAAQAADRQKDRAVRRQPQGQTGFLRRGRGLEETVGDAAGNDVDTVARDPVAAFQQIGEGVGQHDEAVGIAVNRLFDQPAAAGGKDASPFRFTFECPGTMEVEHERAFAQMVQQRQAVEAEMAGDQVGPAGVQLLRGIAPDGAQP